MRTASTWLWSATFVSMLLSGSPALTQSSGRAVAVIVHRSNPTDVLTVHDLEAIFTSSFRRWSGGQGIAPFNYAPNHPLRVEFDRVVLRLDPSGVKRFWVDQRIRGLPAPPRHVTTPEVLVRVVENLPTAIGYVELSHARAARVKIVAVLSQGRVEAPPSSGGTK